jgi:transcriptional regulator with XRE-family HTH domain
MENLLLCCLRLQVGFSPKQMASRLGMETAAYMDIEEGRVELTDDNQDELTKILKIRPQILKAALLQSELFRAGDELIKRQEWVIEMLTALVRILAPRPKCKPR